MQVFQREHVNPYTGERKLVPTIAVVEESRDFYTGRLKIKDLEIPVGTVSELSAMEKRLGPDEFGVQCLMDRSLSEGTLRVYRAVKAQLFMELRLLRPAGFEPDPGVDGVVMALRPLLATASRSKL